MQKRLPSPTRLFRSVLALFVFLTGTFTLSAQCNISAGTLSTQEGGGVFFRCVDDGESDLLTPVITGAQGGNSVWVLSTAAGIIVDFPSGSSFEYEGTSAGVTFLRRLTLGPGFTGNVEVGTNICALTEDDGCFDLSNSITLNLRTGEGCDEICDAVSSAIALTDGSTETTICADGTPDPLDIVMSGDFSGEENTFLITDLEGEILGLPGAVGPIDLDGAGGGTCVIWYIVYDADLEGLATGNNIDELDGCFDLSNDITVVRNANSGGAISLEGGGTETSICTTDGVDEPISVVRDGSAFGDNRTFIITDQATGEILGIPGNNGPFTIDGAGEGVCEIWYLAYTDGLEGLATGNNVADLAGCFSLSNPVSVDRNATEGGAISLEGGGTETSICADDGVDEPIAVVLDGTASGDNGTFVITDQATGEILGIPGNDGPFTIDGAGEGVCEIWYLAYTDGLEGLATGNNVADLTGCFSLSNPVAVDRNTTEGGAISLEGGGTETSICATDDVDEPIAVVLDGTASGDNGTFVITDQATGEILGIPGNNGPFTIDGAGAGVCQIWYLSFADGLEGLAMNNNVSDLSGCFDLSNPITVTRNANSGGAISLEGGGTETSICTTDGVDEPISVIRDGTAFGDNRTFIITDQATGEILGIPGNDGPFTIDGAGEGVCEIWYLAYTDGLEGLATGNNVTDLAGCFSLSNPVSVDRNATEGGAISLEGGGTETSICADDGVDEPIAVVLDGTASGDNGTFVITDQATGEILGIPGNNGPFTIDGAGAGVCQIWYLSFADGLEGLAMNNNVSDLSGCFDLSNPITVTRNVGDDCGGNVCEANGGMLSLADGGTEMSICADDGVDEPINVVRDGNASGDSTAWVITDMATGQILGLPMSDGPFVIDGAGAGVCQIWYIAYDATFSGLTAGGNVADFTGCFDLSNPITVTRNVGDDCSDGFVPDNVIINEIGSDGRIELYNPTGTVINVSEFWLCDFPTYDQLNELTIECGDFMMQPGDYLVVSGFTNFDAVDAELGLYTTNAFGSSDAIISYIRYGGEGGGRSAVAVAAGIWALGGSADAPTPEQSLQTFNDGTALSWSLADETFCEDNGDEDGLLAGDILVTELTATGEVEIQNTTDGAINVSSFHLGSQANGLSALADLPLLCGELNLAAGEVLVVDASALIDVASGEAALFRSDVPNSANLLSYLAYGNFPAGDFTNAAVSAGAWNEGLSLSAPTTDLTLQVFPQTDGTLSYSNLEESLCKVNDASVSTGTIDRLEGVTLFPNPVDDALSLHFEALTGQTTRVEIMDLTGRRLVNRTLQLTSGTATIDLPASAAGTYLLRVVNDGKVATLRFVRN